MNTVSNGLARRINDFLRPACMIAAMAVVTANAGVAEVKAEVLSSTFPATFDPYPTTLPARSAVTVSSGRTVLYSTSGPAGGAPVLLLHGTLSSAASADLFAHYRTASDALNLRFIVPERTGYGDTPYDPTMTALDYADDWHDLLAALGYSQVKIVAISGSGVYADHFVTRYPSSVEQLHLLSGVNTAMTFSACPASTPYDYRGLGQIFIDNPPMFLFLFTPPDVDVFMSIPGAIGWQAMHNADVGDPINNSDIGLSHDFYLYCNSPVTDFSMATFPTFIYHGELDPLVPISDAELHEAQYPNVAAFRRYPNGGHQASLRHVGQVLLDVAGHHEKTILCHNGANLIIDDSAEAAHLAHGDTLDICAWSGTPAEGQ